MWSVLQANSAYNPFPEFAYLGDNLDDGLFAWIQICINATLDFTDDSYYSIVAYDEADGGHENPDSSFMGGGGSDGAPSGISSMPAMPSSTSV
jgi:hypothetical protein